jgi:hypothetical protein
LAIRRRKPLFTDVRVTLSGRNISMPKKLLNGSEVGTAIEKMGSKGVTERVRMGWRCTSSIKNAPNITRRQPSAALVGEQCVTGLGRSRFVSNLTPCCNGIAGGLTDRNSPLFRTFSPHAQRMMIEVE